MTRKCRSNNNHPHNNKENYPPSGSGTAAPAQTQAQKEFKGGRAPVVQVQQVPTRISFAAPDPPGPRGKRSRQGQQGQQRTSVNGHRGGHSAHEHIRTPRRAGQRKQRQRQRTTQLRLVVWSVRHTLQRQEQQGQGSNPSNPGDTTSSRHIGAGQRKTDQAPHGALDRATYLTLDRNRAPNTHGATGCEGTKKTAGVSKSSCKSSSGSRKSRHEAALAAHVGQHAIATALATGATNEEAIAAEMAAQMAALGVGDTVHVQY